MPPLLLQGIPEQWKARIMVISEDFFNKNLIYNLFSYLLLSEPKHQAYKSPKHNRMTPMVGTSSRLTGRSKTTQDWQVFTKRRTNFLLDSTLMWVRLPASLRTMVWAYLIAYLEDM